MLKKRFGALNKQISNGEIVIKHDLTIKENESKSKLSNSLMSNSSSGTIGISSSCDGTCTRDIYWWGQSLGYDPACAKKAIYQANKGARNLGVIGAIAKFLSTVPSIYWMGSWASDMQYNLASNGVICDLNYKLTYNCYGRY